MKYGLLGARLGHSLSPQIHQEVFRQLGIEATYELIEVPTEKLADKVAELRKNYLKTAGLQVLIRIISALPGCLNIMDWCPKEKMSVCWEPVGPAGRFFSALRICGPKASR